MHVDVDDIGAVPRTRRSNRFVKPHAPSAGVREELAADDHFESEMNLGVSLVLLLLVTVRSFPPSFRRINILKIHRLIEFAGCLSIIRCSWIGEHRRSSPKFEEGVDRINYPTHGL